MKLAQPAYAQLTSDCIWRFKDSACIRTLRLKVRSREYAWLRPPPIEVNQVWNYANATSYKAARPFVALPSGPHRL